MRIMALDVGERRIGVALSDPGGILASPHSIIEVPDPDSAVRAILEIAGKEGVGRIIVGLPRLMTGRLGRQAARVRAFVERLGQQTDLPLEYRDERLSTVSARRMMAEGRRRRQRKTRYDAAAAAVILQAYLEEGRNR